MITAVCVAFFCLCAYVAVHVVCMVLLFMITEGAKIKTNDVNKIRNSMYRYKLKHGYKTKTSIKPLIRINGKGRAAE